MPNYKNVLIFSTVGIAALGCAVIYLSADSLRAESKRLLNLLVFKKDILEYKSCITKFDLAAYMLSAHSGHSVDDVLLGRRKFYNILDLMMADHIPDLTIFKNINLANCFLLDIDLELLTALLILKPEIAEIIESIDLDDNLFTKIPANSITWARNNRF